MPTRRCWPACLLLLPLLLSSRPSYGADATRVLHGRVRDEQGRAVFGASIRAVAEASSDDEASSGAQALAEEISDRNGRFRLRIDRDTPLTVVVFAPGFETLRQPVDPSNATRLELRLKSAYREQVDVTASTRPRQPESAESKSWIDVADAPAIALDDLLRSSPSFSLFRRSSSRFANPTTQGVTLRGLGSNGASRALVLDDGIPINDPLGGWIYWSRIPRLDVASVDLLRGGAAARYGTPALGAAVEINRFGARPHGAAVELSTGELGTVDGGLLAGLALGGWDLGLAAESFDTDGFVSVAPEERGSIDRAITERHTTIDLNLQRRFERGGLVARFNHFDESRANGTPFQANQTDSYSWSVGGDREWSRSVATVRVYDLQQDYEQTFSAIAGDRESERPTQRQLVPSEARGLIATWAADLGPPHAILTIGVQGREVLADSDETSFGPPRRVTRWSARQRSTGVSAEYALPLATRCMLHAGARWERWQNIDPSLTVSVNGGPPQGGSLPERQTTSVDPYGTLTCDLPSGWSVSGSGYRGFRAPTLNELYRSFRAGSTLTQANPELIAESLAGGEAALAWRGHGVSARSVVFWNELSDPVTNVTVSVTPSLITRQRRNVGRIRSRGAELELDASLGRSFDWSVSYLYAESEVQDNPADRTLEGLRIAQVPRGIVTTQLRWRGAHGTTLSATARNTGRAFDDDRNTLPLDSYHSVDLWAAQRVGHGVELFVAGENVGDARIEVSRTPVTALGSPRLLRFGLRWESTR